MFRCDQSDGINSVESTDHSLDYGAMKFWRVGSENVFVALTAQSSQLGSGEFGQSIHVDFVLHLRREFTPIDFLVFLLTSSQNT